MIFFFFVFFFVFWGGGIYLVFLQQEKRLFTNFHRQLFCWIDKWIDLNMEDIRRMEEETRRELDEVSKKKKRWRIILNKWICGSNWSVFVSDESEGPGERHGGSGGLSSCVNAAVHQANITIPPPPLRDGLALNDVSFQKRSTQTPADSRPPAIPADTRSD